MTPSPSAQTGANVRAEMARRGVSQVKMAAALGLSQPSVSARLRGVTPFDVDELHAVADFLDVPVAALLPSEVARAGVA
jgi:transcriptional regulator with XRE-family HTH domain